MVTTGGRGEESLEPGDRGQADIAVRQRSAAGIVGGLMDRFEWYSGMARGQAAIFTRDIMNVSPGLGPVRSLPLPS